MEKRAVVAIALSFLILVAWSYLFPPAERPATEPAIEPAPIEATGDTQPEATPTQPVASEADTELAPEPDVEGPVVSAAEEQQVSVSNGPLEVVLTNRGGRVSSWVLTDYNGRQDKPLELVGHFKDADLLPLSIELDDAELAGRLNEALYDVKRQTVSGSSVDGEKISFHWADGRGLQVRKSFTFWKEGWLVDVELDVRDRGRRLPARLSVGPGFSVQEPRAGKSTYYYAGQGVWNLDGQVTRRRPKKMHDGGGALSGGIVWAGLEDQYFTALILPNDRPAEVKWRSMELIALPPPGATEEEETPEAAPQPILSVSVGEDGAQLFIGPKKYTLLTKLGHQLPKSVWFATNGFLAAISKFLFLVLVWIYDHVAGNYGLAIVLTTMLLRIILFPINQYSMVSMKKTQLQMQRLQPKIKAIKAKYKKAKDAQSRAKMNQETMDLYKREGVNPAGGVAGCLPLLAQFPILIGFYNMLTVAVELRGAPFFGWIQDLAHKDPYWITPLLMGVTMFLQQRMAMSKVKDPMQQQQQKFMLFMPFIFTYICLQMPAGMVLYWFVNNLLGIGQQWLVNRHTGRLEASIQKA